MEILRASVYDFPHYYDLVYGSDWKAEFGFLRGSFERYAERTVHRVFEPACGTGRLLFRLAKSGLDLSGVDLNERAVEYCNKRLLRHGLPAAAWVADMAAFHLSEEVDAAFNMINSFRHLLDETTALRHLQLMARSLRHGGLYILGFHMTPTRGETTDEEFWSARRGHLVVNSHLWTRRRDLCRRLEHCDMTYDVHTPTRLVRLVDDMMFRTYTWSQVQELLEKVPAFQIVGVHDFAYDLNNQIRVMESTEDVVLVLKRI